MLKVRKFRQEKDEEAWVRVRNAENREDKESRQMTVEEMRVLEKAPNFTAKGMFIAELDGQPVGIIHAYVDEKRKEKKGFLRNFGVIPEFRGIGIEEKLVKTALIKLQKREMYTVQAWTHESRKDRIDLWEKNGFKLVRKFSLMKRIIDDLLEDIGNQEVTITNVNTDLDEDLKQLNYLDNECFKEHFNYRPSTIEQTKFFTQKDPWFKDQAWFFTTLNNQHVGYVGVGIDKKYNVEKNSKCGWILDIGVLKPFRRRKIGTRLMMQSIQALKNKGMNAVLLGVDDWNVTKAMHLYEKVGFQVVKKDLTYEREI
jgi:mycothiol synthase